MSNFRKTYASVPDLISCRLVHGTLLQTDDHRSAQTIEKSQATYINRVGRETPPISGDDFEGS